jgi:hypothetical protein
MDKKPGLALMITSALAKKGKASHDPMPEDDESDGMDYMKHLEEVASDILQAVEDKDAKALAELLHEAFQVCDMQPHEEGPHTDEE